MKYIVMDCGEDIFTTEYENKDEATKEAERQWSYLTEREKRNRVVQVLESVNPDENAEDHFDGNVVWTSR